jgi:hypothetical protein
VKIFSDKHLTIKETWRASFHLYSKTFTHVWPQAVFIGITTAIVAWLSMHSSCKFDIQKLTIANSGCAFANLIMLLLVIYLGGVVLYRIYVFGKGHTVTLQDSFNLVGKRYLNLVGGVLLVTASCLLVGFLFLILPVILGVLCLISLGTFLLVAFIVVQPLILLDNKGCFTALRDSYNLVWGSWWHVFAIVIPLMLLNYIISYVVQFTAVRGGWWYGALGSAIIATFFYPLLYSCILILFNDLKLRHHTGGL